MAKLHIVCPVDIPNAPLMGDYSCWNAHHNFAIVYIVGYYGIIEFRKSNVRKTPIYEA